MYPAETHHSRFLTLWTLWKAPTVFVNALARADKLAVGQPVSLLSLSCGDCYAAPPRKSNLSNAICWVRNVGKAQGTEDRFRSLLVTKDVPGCQDPVDPVPYSLDPYPQARW